MPSLRFPLLWVVIVGLHVAAAVLAWHLLPHGFGWGHPRFWSNEVIPFVLVALGIACLFGLWRRRARLASLAIAVFIGLHIAMGPAWILVFPITGKRPALAFAASTLVLCACGFASLRHTRGVRWPMSIGVVIGMIVGVGLPWSQRGPAPGTHPAEAVRPLEPPVASRSHRPLPDWIHLVPDTDVISVDIGSVHIALQPLLTFWSRSPDRGWTALADVQQRMGPLRRYGGTSGDTYRYTGEEPGTIRVSASGDDVVHVEAKTLVPTAVYSHLNTFCAMEIRGHHHLFLAFSPFPDQRIEVTYSEYPVGRPLRFAFVDAASVLHVVEAESGEKGPFEELAHGPLPSSGTLGITIFDEVTPIAQIELADFASQASTQPSPTAGWGVPENAIEFSLRRDDRTATAAIYITLAGTSVGRGWDSVGHAPGVYRDRIDLRRLLVP